MEQNTDPEVPKFIRDAIKRRQGLDSSPASSEGGADLSIGEFQGPVPGHIQKGIDVKDSRVATLQNQQNKLADRLDSQGIAGEEKNRLLVPVIEKKTDEQRQAEHIRSEFDLPAKYPTIREGLKTPVDNAK